MTGKSESWFDINHDPITYGNLIRPQEDLIRKYLTRFGFDLNLSGFELDMIHMGWPKSMAMFYDIYG